MSSWGRRRFSWQKTSAKAKGRLTSSTSLRSLKMWRAWMLVSAPSAKKSWRVRENWAELTMSTRTKSSRHTDSTRRIRPVSSYYWQRQTKNSASWRISTTRSLKVVDRCRFQILYLRPSICNKLSRWITKHSWAIRAFFSKSLQSATNATQASKRCWSIRATKRSNHCSRQNSLKATSIPREVRKVNSIRRSNLADNNNKTQPMAQKLSRGSQHLNFLTSCRLVLHSGQIKWNKTKFSTSWR